MHRGDRGTCVNLILQAQWEMTISIGWSTENRHTTHGLVSVITLNVCLLSCCVMRVLKPLMEAFNILFRPGNTFCRKHRMVQY